MGTLKEIFGPSKNEIWSQIADEIGGEYIDAGFWKKNVLKFQHNHWEILLDTYAQSTGKSSVTYTRLRVPFLNRDGLRFKIYRENFFTSIGKIFGMQDIIIGDPWFDDDFIIKGNDESKIKLLMNDSKLKSLFKQQPKVHIEIKDYEGRFSQRYPEGVDVLYFQCVGIVKKREVLLNLFELFAAILDRLVHIDSAYQSNPKIELK